ncbi:helix-turn-helix domain-containing protein [Microbacterium allomyrinae]
MWLASRRSGLSVQELAERLEVSRNTVSAWINGHNRPRSRDLKAFALATGYPLAWLETGEAPTPVGPEGSPVTHR